MYRHLIPPDSKHRSYRGRYRVGDNPKVHEVTLHTTVKEVAEKLLKEIHEDAQKESVDLIPSALTRKTKRRPLPSLLDEYLEDVRKNGRTHDHIRSFTSLSEGMKPEQLTKLLHEYFNEMTEAVLSTDGIVDKFIGDAIMAFWGAPMEQPDQADRAVTAAIDMIQRLKKLQRKWLLEGFPVIDVGIGINLGMATVGNMGSSSRFDYTIIGDAVNVAARIEGLNKQFDSHILISGSIRDRITISAATKDLGKVSVRGKSEPVHIYEVLTPS